MAIIAATHRLLQYDTDHAQADDAADHRQQDQSRFVSTCTSVEAREQWSQPPAINHRAARTTLPTIGAERTGITR